MINFDGKTLCEDCASPPGSAPEGTIHQDLAAAQSLPPATKQGVKGGKPILTMGLQGQREPGYERLDTMHLFFTQLHLPTWQYRIPWLSTNSSFNPGKKPQTLETLGRQKAHTPGAGYCVISIPGRSRTPPPSAGSLLRFLHPSAQLFPITSLWSHRSMFKL